MFAMVVGTALAFTILELPLAIIGLFIMSVLDQDRRRFVQSGHIQRGVGARSQNDPRQGERDHRAGNESVRPA